MEAVIAKIKDLRIAKGYSHENMAHMLDISQVAYTKLERNQTKLTVERLFKIAEILDTPVGDLLDIQPNNQFNQTNRETSTGYLQQIENFYQENKDQNQKIVELFEARLVDQAKIIEQLEQLYKPR